MTKQQIFKAGKDTYRTAENIWLMVEMTAQVIAAVWLIILTTKTVYFGIQAGDLVGAILLASVMTKIFFSMQKSKING